MMHKLHALATMIKTRLRAAGFTDEQSLPWITAEVLDNALSLDDVRLEEAVELSLNAYLQSLA